MNTKKTTERKIAGYLAKGLRCTEIAPILGISAKQVQRIAKDLREQVKRDKLHPKEQAKALFANEYTKAEIARLLKVHVNTVTNWLKEAPKSNE